jgi:Zn-finger nucleic acid-binding protein
MVEERVGEVAIDRCPSCHGIWLDMGELEKLLEADPKPLLAEDRCFQSEKGEAGPRRNCPRCKGAYLIKLNSRLRPGTILDSCTVCYGAWLDAGEFTRLARADLITRLRGLFRL